MNLPHNIEPSPFKIGAYIGHAPKSGPWEIHRAYGLYNAVRLIPVKGEKNFLQDLTLQHISTELEQL